MSPLPLAFAFGSPLVLSGLLLAGIPLIIHLLHRKNYLETRWAAMRFLLEATRKQSRRIRIEHLLLLLVRTLILALIVLAMAQPSMDVASGVFRGALPLHRIIVMDASFSMQFNDASADQPSDDDSPMPLKGTCFARAKQAARDLVLQGKRGDAWNLVLIADREPLAIISQPSFSSDSVLEEIQRMAVTDSPGNLARTLAAVAECSKLAPEVHQKEVVFITDNQASLWAPESASAKSAINPLMDQISTRAKVTLINVASTSPQNAAVTAFTTDTAVGIVGRPMRFVTTLRNFGSIPLRDQTVELLIDGRFVDSKRVDLGIGVDLILDWAYQFETPGEHKLEVHLEDDALPLDNHRWLTTSIRDKVRVLIAEGRPSGDSRHSASFYLAQALVPTKPFDEAASLFQSQIVAQSDLSTMDLTVYDSILLTDAPALTPKQVSVLEEFVSHGRGLIVFPSSDFNASDSVLASQIGGKELLPARIGKLINPANKDNPFTFDARGFAHPILKPFQGVSNVALEATLTFHFVELVPLPDARVCLWYNDGHPALVEHQFGTGRVVLSATSADITQGTWAFSGHSFVPFIHETVLFSLGDQNAATRRLLVGQPLISTTAAQLADQDPIVLLPNGENRSLQSTKRNDLTVTHFEETHRAGIYTFQPTGSSTHTQYYSVNVNASECDLSPFTQQDQTHVAITKSGFGTSNPTNLLSTHPTATFQNFLEDLARQIAFLGLILMFFEQFITRSSRR